MTAVGVSKMKRFVRVGVCAVILVVSFYSAWTAATEAAVQALISDKSEKGAQTYHLKLQSGVLKVIDLNFKPAEEAGEMITIGNPTVVATQLIRMSDKFQVQLIPLKAGKTNVNLRDVEGTLRVIIYLDVIQ